MSMAVEQRLKALWERVDFLEKRVTSLESEMTVIKAVKPLPDGMTYRDRGKDKQERKTLSL